MQLTLRIGVPGGSGRDCGEFPLYYLARHYLRDASDFPIFWYHPDFGLFETSVATGHARVKSCLHKSGLKPPRKPSA